MSSNFNQINNLTPQLIQDYEELIRYLAINQYQFPQIPQNLTGDNKEGEVFSMAYPIQGILKYHGLSNPDLRIAYNSSISLNNTCAKTITFLKMDSSIQADQIILNGIKLELQVNEAKRIRHMLNIIRTISGIKTPVRIISRNIMSETGLPTTGKGLGTSASGGAAIAHGMMEIIYKKRADVRENPRLRSVFARYLAGSAARSSVGGISLWMNHPKMETWDSYAIRLDRVEDEKFLKNLALITIAIPSNIKTDQAHLAAPTSPFFEPWIRNRNPQIYRLIEALHTHELTPIGELAEYDTLSLHAVTNTATAHSLGPLISPESLAIMLLCQELRRSDIPVYYSLDTGPSVVLITKSQYVTEIRKALLDKLSPTFHEAISIGSIGGSSSIIKDKTQIPTILLEDLEKYGR